MKRILSLWSFLIFFLSGLGPSTALAADEYLLQPGDVLDVRVAGLPNLDRLVRIEGSGEISLPLAGRIMVAGMTLANGEDLIAGQMSRKIFTQRGINGDEALFAINADDISVEVDSYVPIYVIGDVRVPGSFDFLPGLTVLRVIGLSGGVGTPLALDQDMTPRIMQLRTRARALQAEIDTLETKIARLSAPVTPEGDAVAGADNSDATVSDVETSILSAQQSSAIIESAFLRNSKAAVEREIKILQDQLSREMEGEEVDKGEYDRLTKLRDNGLVPVDRLASARRAWLAASTRRLETAGELASLEREVGQIEFQLEEMFTKVDLERLDDLSDVLARHTQVSAEMVGVLEELQSLNAGFVVDEGGPAVNVTITRSDGQVIENAAQDDVAIQPGDLITVTLTFEQ
ncbi:polysaccharide biosynthesis/export family protein [uncultured Tateyamaria sp.]|uniref:polysaccharide biosynthesis/export family protein n=1 Tax=uncultured Tateyamaria sp. TaxID=455651 RepID=UPI00260C1D7F|nr:polysaccharide biosynthesis/export family protein [uncultured Tateyamaria sp.]